MRGKKKAWWDELLPHVGGDAIVANIGADAQGVVVGKNIQQNITSVLGAPTPKDRPVIEQRLAELSAALEKTRGQLDETTAKMAEFQIKRLGGELTKTAEKETPNASTITQVGDWLLQSVPQIAETLVGLFATPAVGKVVGKAGEVAIRWAKQRFGQAGS